MCARITLLTYGELENIVRAVERRLDPTALKLDASDRAQARPGGEVPAIVGALGEMRVEPLTWGFPSPDKKSLVFNTRIESALAGSRMWADAARDGRCIVPVASFFEPHATETAINPRTGRRVKQQYEFSDESRLPLLLAGVQHGGRLSIVTTEPNDTVARIHPRMPLALRFREVPTWMEGDWPSLADRSRLALESRPEFTPRAGADQLSLF